MHLSRRSFIGVAASAIAVGCSRPYDNESIGRYAYAVGCTAGAVIAESGMCFAVREVIAGLVRDIAGEKISLGRSVSSFWSSAARIHVAAMVFAGVITARRAAVVLAAMSVVVRAFEIIEGRYPGIADAAVIVDTAVSEFIRGIVSTLVSSDTHAKGLDTGVHSTLSASREFSELCSAVLSYKE